MNTNINIEINKKIILKNFFCEYKLLTFFIMIIMVLLTIAGIKLKDIYSPILFQYLNLCMLLLYLIFIFYYIIQYNYTLKIHDSEVYINSLFKKYKFNIMDVLSIKIDSSITDNQQDEFYIERRHSFHRLNEDKTGIAADILFDPIIALIRKLRKVEKESIYVETQFFNNNQLTKLKIPYKTIKTINYNAKVYQYISETDMNDLLYLFNTREQNNNDHIGSQERENRRKSIKITTSKKDLILLVVFVIGFSIVCYILGASGF